ncbi:MULTISPECIES: ABC transporter ATP-binding protein [unclassified Paenibacillus]|uniref:ABC transporter ATP-binding protein n=1 Tax=unclassified Paenibacillus TaxID=185978 RepID=UPI001C11A32F|nr:MULTISPECIES: ABC transporter ATP-binding protein [unclassified Paenibacillus]MBU5440584.1 ABC transporter ATP-binding protein [Paenibacillus sp. MSJ-34]CAH0120050.1 Linearmycin resistance ATP-binding protein LnrL [Paenibacillus sp. CECT 9249]
MGFVVMQDVLKRYGTKITVNHLNLTIEQGEIFGLLGPNGAGKSTLIKMMSGLLPIDRGEIRVGGVSVAERPLAVKRKIGLVPQELAIYEMLTARENVHFFGKLYGLRGKQLMQRVDEALEFVGLTDRQNEKPAAFSGGMKRRLNIACAIMHRPEFIIMDEPTVGIDPQSRNHILQSVRQLNEMGSTIIYTSHYMEEVEAIGTRVGIIDHGELIACGTKDELLQELGGEEKLSFSVQEMNEEAAEELRRHPGLKMMQIEERSIEITLKAADSVLQDIMFILAKHQVRVQSFTRTEPNLESLFLTLTGRTLRD